LVCGRLDQQRIPEVRVKLMMRSAIVVLTGLTACISGKHSPITQDELIRNTQQLFDSVAAGDQAPWKKYFADDSIYFDEKGRSMDKTSLVNDVTPLPKGYSGSIKVVNAREPHYGHDGDPDL
jgi:hypothetical protein